MDLWSITVKYYESVESDEMQICISAGRPEDGLLFLRAHNSDLLTTSGASQFFLLIINHIEFSVQSSIYVIL